MLNSCQSAGTILMNRTSYHPASVLLHWLLFILFAVALTAIELKGEFPKGDPMRGNLMSLHMLAGQLVLLFAAFRLAARLRFGVPPEVAGPAWQTLSAKLVHILLYLVMFCLPISGILTVQSGGHEVMFFGWALPHLIAPDPDLRHTIKDMHELVGNAVYYLVGLHVLGALWHHFLRKDEVLRRMLRWHD
jgi:cytochrome b561